MKKDDSQKKKSKRPKKKIDNATKAALIEAAEEAAKDIKKIGHIGNEPVFVLAQYLRGVDLSKDVTFDELMPSVRHWFDLVEDKLIDMDKDPLSFADVWSMFVEVWNKVRYPKRKGLTRAIARAVEATYSIPELDWCNDENVELLARVCHELSKPDGLFFLSGYDAGDILLKNQTRGREKLNMFQESKIIKCTKAGNRYRAADYEYIGKPVINGKSTQDK